MEVGKKYLVPCIEAAFGKKVVWLPIMGERHPDPELNNNKFHYHIDYRFLTHALIRWIRRGRDFDSSTIMVHNAHSEKPIYYRSLRLKRNFVLIHDRHSICGNVNGVDAYEFEKLMENAEVVERNGCKFCPHKGMPLADAAEFLPNKVECPGHGLLWDLTTGKMVKRMLPPAECVDFT